MKQLLSQRERDRIIARVKKQKYATDRKNVAPWCVQWLAIAFSFAWLTAYFVADGSGLTRNLFFAIAWLFVAGISHCQWERYKDQSILKQKLDEFSEHPLSPPDASTKSLRSRK